MTAAEVVELVKTFLQSIKTFFETLFGLVAPAEEEESE